MNLFQGSLSVTKIGNASKVTAVLHIQAHPVDVMHLIDGLRIR